MIFTRGLWYYSSLVTEAVFMLPIHNLNSWLPKRASNRSVFIKWQSVDILVVNRKFRAFLSKNRVWPRIIHLKSYLPQNTLYYLSTPVFKDQCYKELCFRALAQQILLFCSLLGILFSVTLVLTRGNHLKQVCVLTQIVREKRGHLGLWFTDQNLYEKR